MTFKISSCPVGTNVICEKLARWSVIADRATMWRAPTSLARPLPGLRHNGDVKGVRRWFQLPSNPSSDSKYTTAHLRWRANGYFITTWTFKDGNVPSCFIGIAPYRRVNRDGFFEAVSAALELKPISENKFPTLRQEMYQIVGRPLRLLFSSNVAEGTMSGASIYWSPP
jgi:hypothetical protein